MPSACATCSKPNASAICSRCKCVYYCDINCQRKDWKQHKKICKTLANNKSENTSTSPIKHKNNNDDEKSVHKTAKKKVLFRIEKVEGKGFGMIANRNISAGTMILNENPLLSLISDSNLDIRSIDINQFNKKFAKPLLQRFKNLTSDEQEIINSLSYKYDGSVLDIFLNNCLTNENNGFDGLYANIARINHSCAANCLHWIQAKENNFNGRIIALRDIKKNEELTINYMGWNPFFYKERAVKLLNGWKIEKCECLRCNKKMREKWDGCIQEYKRLDVAIAEIKAFNEKYIACKKIVKLIEDKFDENPQLLYRHCWDLAQCSLYVMRRDEFVTNLIKTVKYKRLAHGRDTKIPGEVEEMINQMPPDIQKKIKSKIIEKK